MKKLTLTAFIVCLIAMSSVAQNTRFGLTATPTFNFVKSNDKDVDADGVKLGINYGLMVDFRLDNNERYAFSTGFTHHVSGANITREMADSTGNFTASQKLKLQYVELPATFRLRTNEVGYLTYYGLFGITPGILVSGRYDQSADADPNGDRTLDNAKINGSQLFNLGLTFGAGVEYSLSGATSLIAGLYYSNGFTNIVNDKDNDKDDKLSLKTLALRLGFFF